eukprot:scpid11422/ scgid23769/ Cysteine proteinase 1
MESALIFVVSLLVPLCGAELSFQEWRAEYGEEALFADDNILIDREQVYYDNVKLIQRLNEEDNGAEFRVNQFAAMTPEEFRHQVLMRPQKPFEFKETRYMESVEAAAPLPTSFDWTTHSNVVTSVKNQGALGSCWAFSTVGNVEGQWGLKNGLKNGNDTLQSLSTMQILSCDAEKDIAHGRADCGAFGGWPYLAYQYLMKAGGIEPDVDYPYCVDGCFPCAPHGYNVSLCGQKVEYCRKNDSCPAMLRTQDFVPGLQLADWKAISTDETEIAQQLVDIGPLSVAMDATLLNFYHSGVFHPPFCSKTELDHAVLIVGFGVEKELLSTKPYWLVKNSWGAKWGQKGYFKIMRGEGTCGINTQVTTSVLK